MPVLPGDEAVAETWGILSAAATRRGRPRLVNDMWIAACCLTHQVPLAARNPEPQGLPGLLRTPRPESSQLSGRQAPGNQYVADSRHSRGRNPDCGRIRLTEHGSARFPGAAYAGYQAWSGPALAGAHAEDAGRMSFSRQIEIRPYQSMRCRSLRLANSTLPGPYPDVVITMLRVAPSWCILPYRSRT